MEGRVYVCSWERVGKRFRVWVKSRPKLAAEGPTFTEADEALWSLIIEKTDDGENSREYEPRAPVDAKLEKFLTPALVVVIGDAIVRVQAAAEYDGARCSTCGHIGGRRTDDPLVAADLESGFDAGFVVLNQRPFAAVRRYVFSDEFLALLRPEERKRFAWRRVVRPRRAKRAFHELLEAELTVESVGVSGLPKKTRGWQCGRCGFRRFPHYVGLGWPSHWVCAKDLPRRVPSCFGLSDGRISRSASPPTAGVAWSANAARAVCCRTRLASRRQTGATPHRSCALSGWSRARWRRQLEFSAK